MIEPYQGWSEWQSQEQNRFIDLTAENYPNSLDGINIKLKVNLGEKK